MRPEIAPITTQTRTVAVAFGYGNWKMWRLRGLFYEVDDGDVTYRVHLFLSYLNSADDAVKNQIISSVLQL